MQNEIVYTNDTLAKIEYAVFNSNEYIYICTSGFIKNDNEMV